MLKLSIHMHTLIISIIRHLTQVPCLRISGVGLFFSHIDNDWISAGFYTVADLPIQAGKIDVIAVTQ